MPDISMCGHAECPSRKSCYRHAESGTKPNGRRQAYMTFEPCKDDGKCWAYVPDYGHDLPISKKDKTDD